MRMYKISLKVEVLDSNINVIPMFKETIEVPPVLLSDVVVKRLDPMDAFSEAINHLERLNADIPSAD